jgi:hypothetical protein
MDRTNRDIPIEAFATGRNEFHHLIRIQLQLLEFRLFYWESGSLISCNSSSHAASKSATTDQDERREEREKRDE